MQVHAGRQDPGLHRPGRTQGQQLQEPRRRQPRREEQLPAQLRQPARRQKQLHLQHHTEGDGVHDDRGGEE